MSKPIKINEKPVRIFMFPDDGFIGIETETGQLLGLTHSDTKKLIKMLTEQVESYKLMKAKRGVPCLIQY